jgi:hypothetical protein
MICLKFTMLLNANTVITVQGSLVSKLDGIMMQSTCFCIGLLACLVKKSRLLCDEENQRSKISLNFSLMIQSGY